MDIKFSDFHIIPDFNSVHKEGIDDETYFGDKYKKFISNSRLKWIDPNEGGTPQLFKNPPKLTTASLTLGSIIHECVLQPESFYLAPKVGKPSAKLGMVFDEIEKLTKKNQLSDDIIRKAALKVDYYSKTVDAKINIIKEAFEKYIENKQKIVVEDNKIPRFLSDKDWEIATACINSLKENKIIQNTLFPKDCFEEPYKDIYCEDAFFMDFLVTYQDKHCARLPFKLKIDNWTINDDNMTISLNDLKTTGHSTNQFIDGSFNHYHYYRQLGVYMSVLEAYLLKEQGLSTKTGWKFESNICAVETIPNYWSNCFRIPEEELHRGIIEFSELMKRVAGYEIFGYDTELNFV